jgi:phosphoribosylaminoimidazolecarboxamide formyltransferase/IMP cyclohydrolase
MRALISVSDKSGLVPFARGLAEIGWEILSTGGTASALTAAGVPVIPIEAVTGFPEMMDGRVKTLHPAVHGAILADRGRLEHMEALRSIFGTPIDLVVVNLYPFQETVARPDVTEAEAIERIDIGGPAMLRSAAKNWRSVAVVVSPSQYDAVLAELREGYGARAPLSDETRRRLAEVAFAHTAAYDAAIAAYFTKIPSRPGAPFPDPLSIAAVKRQELRYGENPHQRGAFYVDPAFRGPGVATARQLHGIELSYINLLDLDAALALVREFDRPAAAIIKHTNPCGCGVADALVDAYQKAREGELPPFNPPGSRFGGVIAFNRAVDAATAEAVIAPKSFYHAIIAPEFHPEALELLKGRSGWGADLRLLAVGDGEEGDAGWEVRSVAGGYLVQERDRRALTPEDLKIVTKRAPTEAEMADLLFAWKVVKHVKSNAIVLARDEQVIGVGAGQMNRALPVDLAVQMAGDRVQGSALASDAFFPHPDGPEHAARAGVTAIIQPGGSKRDADAVAVADAHGLAMVLTGVRHFRH